MHLKTVTMNVFS